MPSPRTRASALALLALPLLAARPSATWSVVVVNTLTGEACVAAATCINNFDLKTKLPVVIPGVGAGAAQSLIDTGGFNKKKIFENLLLGNSPQFILDLIEQTDGAFQSRQFGIVNMNDLPVTFTGTNAGIAKEGVVGQVGALRYAIQGNVLTGKEVVYAAETALLATEGDLGQRVMAAMEAARALGGDGRCSCSPAAPTSCGVPPPSFTKAAHCGFIVLSRVGDAYGACSGFSCVTGQHYLELNVAGNDAAVTDPDPILQLQSKYALWRAQHAGHPDHLKSTLWQSADALVADGADALFAIVQAVDLEGQPIGHGGATVTLVQHSGPAGLASASPVTDLGDGRYSVTLTAGSTAGEGSFDVVIDDGSFKAQLYPPLALRVDPLAPLHVGYDSVSAAQALDIPFVLNQGAAAAGQPYAILASASGSLPGVDLASGVHLPLNPDVFTLFTLKTGGLAFFPGGVGLLDADGRATAQLQLSAGSLAGLAGHSLSFASLLRVAPPVVSNAVELPILP